MVERGSTMILSNLDHIPGRKMERTIGVVFGYSSSGKKNASGKKVFRELFEKARDDLMEHCRELSGDAVVKIDGKITRDEQGRPEMMLVGTAVELEKKSSEGSVTVSMEGEKRDWEMPPASTSSEIADMIRDRGRSDRDKKKQRKDIYDLADEIGISYDRAKLLTDHGFRTMEEISGASNKELSAIVGINPTQARILKRKARDLLNEEKGL